MNSFYYYYFLKGACGGLEHRDRMENALKKLSHSHWWNNQGGADHVFIAPWWGAKVHGMSITWSDWLLLSYYFVFFKYFNFAYSTFEILHKFIYLFIVLIIT
jgi:hypothetical protein